MEIYEKLGVFYLGRHRAEATGETTADPLLYDSRDLLTHAVCVGMTGSGKTGLCLGLLEEAAMDGIPALIVDPKGDLGNLLLTFPDLAPGDFLPWVGPEEAQRKGKSREELAAETAGRWSDGLAKWGQSGERIARLREKAEFAIYTPGSDAGRPVSVLASFAAPPQALVEDGDLFRERIATAATSLLGLVGVAGDPLRSREHILLSTLFEKAWREGRDYDLAALIRDVQKPPVTQMGALDLDTFCPASDRFQLALTLNNVLAAPAFASWLAGEALDVDRLLYTASGKPRHAIFSIAHLSEPERMFFLSLLLEQTLGWMRTKPGATSLRAILYIDEIFGFLPPVANPPTKRPLLTLFKQARAFGLGVVVATQNPVDLDYKALANAGTWFLGRLQTDQDRARVLDGLFGSTGGEGSRRAQVAAALPQLGNRVFLMHDVHRDEPVLFETRWAMSYLAGPLTREQIRRLEGDRPAPPAPAPGATAAPASGPVPAPVAGAAGGARPILSGDVVEVFVEDPIPAGTWTYAPAVLGVARCHFRHPKLERPEPREVALLADLPERAAAIDWLQSDRRQPDLELADRPVDGATFGAIQGSALKATQLRRWSSALQETLSREESLELFLHPASGLLSLPGESDREFRIRLAEQLREQRDEAVAALRRKYETKVRQAEERVLRARIAVEREQAQAKNQKVQTVISVGTTILGGLLGRRAISATTLGRAGTAARGVSRSAKEARDVAHAEERLAREEQLLADLERAIEEEIARITSGQDLGTADLERLALRPRKTDVEVLRLALAWVPRPVA
ncbi:MAG: ATP-binding protein [Thermoanaerobaculia bacterium]|nr:ATP-binding protein [Thermoanaerobaculia bacterium]